jgi:DNA (cytosine-5)-methyltransferase 1
MEQLNINDLYKNEIHIKKPIRLIELFAGIGAQAMALRNLGANFEHYRAIEYDKYPIASYNAIHGTDFKPMDITKIKGVDLGIEDVEQFTYLLIPFLAKI